MKIYVAIICMFAVLLLSVFVGCKSKNENTDDSSSVNTSSISDSSNNEMHTEESMVDAYNKGDNITEDKSSKPLKDDDEASNTQSKGDTSHTTTPQKNPSTSTEDNSKPSGDAEKNKEDDDLLTFEEYSNLTAAEQQAYYESFDSVEAFAKWYRTAQEKYKENEDTINIGGDGTVNLEDLLK